MNDTSNLDHRELTEIELRDEELEQVVGGSGIVWTYTKQSGSGGEGGGGGDAGAAISAWNTLLKQYGAA
jgi:hypothetical protein